MNLFTEEVVIRTPGGPTGETDAMGRPIESPPTEHSALAWVEIGSSEEETEARERQVWGYTVYLPLSTAVSAQGDIQVRGEWFAVKGTPTAQPGGFIVDGYLYVVVVREEG